MNKFLLIIFSAYLISGCVEPKTEDLSIDIDPSKLIGSYISECYYSPRLDKFVIENLDYSNSSYTNDINQYTSADCSSEIDDTLYTFGTITYETEVMTTDGLTASKAYFDNDTGGVAPQFEVIMPVVYRKDEDSLNFGAYTEGEIPTINYSITYFKQ
ncbi:MAG: hypothetical protein HRU20_18630 [Pseudomonadales bacterium]|nr:hypothetical protein [Pseudomonadales bacterium]NRB40454.1 hypothetical protein [Pseudomonadales bacterium]